jgi:hypothetical protein
MQHVATYTTVQLQVLCRWAHVFFEQACYMSCCRHPCVQSLLISSKVTMGISQH